MILSIVVGRAYYKVDYLGRKDCRVCESYCPNSEQQTTSKKFINVQQSNSPFTRRSYTELLKPAFAVLPLQTLFIAFLKLTASSMPTASPSGSAKCLRFGH